MITLVIKTKKRLFRLDAERAQELLGGLDKLRGFNKIALTDTANIRVRFSKEEGLTGRRVARAIVAGLKSNILQSKMFLGWIFFFL